MQSCTAFRRWARTRFRGRITFPPQPSPSSEPLMQTLRVNGYDMAYLDVGQGQPGAPPLLCVHGSLCDFRIWSAVLGPLTAKHRVIAVSLRHFFPDHWDGVGDTYPMRQDGADVVGLIEQGQPRPVELMGHSRGGHVCFRVAQRRPDMLRRLILAEPGGELDGTLDSNYKPGPSPLAARIAASAAVIAKGDIDGGLEIFVDALEGPGAWKRLPGSPKHLLPDNATTLIGQTRDQRPPFSKADAEAIRTPTLFIGGAKTKGVLPVVLHALAAHVKGSRTEMIARATHPMFEQQPQRYCEIVLDFLGA